MAKKRQSLPRAGSSILIVSLVIAGLIGLAYLANNITGSSAATLSSAVINKNIPETYWDTARTSYIAETYTATFPTVLGTVLSDDDYMFPPEWRNIPPDFFDNMPDKDKQKWVDFFVNWLDRYYPGWRDPAGKSISPYPPCQDELDAAHKTLSENKALAQMREEAHKLWEDIENIDRYIRDHPDISDNYRRELELSRSRIWRQYFELSQKINRYVKEVYAAYNACVAGEKRKMEERWNRLPWYQKILPVRPQPPAIQSSTPSSSTRTLR